MKSKGISMSFTHVKSKLKSKSIVLTTLFIMGATFPVWLLGLLFFIWLISSPQISIKENLESISRFPFLTDISCYLGGNSNYSYYEGTIVTSWADIKKHFKDVEWQQIDKEGIAVRCHKFSRTHSSQLESRTQNRYYGHEQDTFCEEINAYIPDSPYYDHKISHGFFARRERGRIREEIFFDSENNRFFYLWECVY